MTSVLVAAFALLVQGDAPSRLPPTVEAFLGLRDLREVRVAPAGDAVAFTVRAADPDANVVRTELYIWRPDGPARRLTRGRDDVRRPRWSPDGGWLAFLSAGVEGDANGDRPRQVWALPIRAGGEAIQLSRLRGGVLDYGWAPDGSIYALTRETPSPLIEALTERERDRGDDPRIVRDDAERRREFWRIEVPDGTAEFVWRGDRGIAEMAVSPDGERIAFTTNYSGATDDFARFDLWVLDLDAAASRQITDRSGAERAPAWSPDGSTLAFRAPQDADLFYSQTELFRVPTAGGTPRVLTDAFDRSVVDHAWPRGGQPLFTAALGAYTHLFAVGEDGAIERLTSGQHNYGDFGVAAADGTIYAVRESSTRGPELWRVGGRIERLTSLNDRVDGWRLARQEVISWRAPDGLAIEGVLVYPLDYEEGRRYPLLVNPHGGPSSRVRDVLDQFHWHQLFAAHGYAVLAPNFRGSRGYGASFGTANRRDLGGGDFADLMAGVDRVIEMGIADSARLGIYGGSYGGYMTNWAISQTDRFGAAVSMYGIFSLVTDYSNSNIPSFEPGYLDARYWEDPAIYRERSPMTYVDEIRTPVLIVHGAEDPNTFIANSNEMYRALRDLGRTVEYLRYPREGHGIREPRHRIDLFFRQLRWFDRHLDVEDDGTFDFYFVDEWVPGPRDWEMRVVRGGDPGQLPGRRAVDRTVPGGDPGAQARQRGHVPGFGRRPGPGPGRLRPAGRPGRVRAITRRHRHRALRTADPRRRPARRHPDRCLRTGSIDGGGRGPRVRDPRGPGRLPTGRRRLPARADPGRRGLARPGGTVRR